MKRIGIEPVDFPSLVSRIWKRQELGAKKLEKQHHDAWRINVSTAIQQHAKMVCYVDGTLTLSVVHSTASHQIRFMQKVILAGLKKAKCFKGIKKIAVVIIPEPFSNVATPQAPDKVVKKKAPTPLPESAVSSLKSMINDDDKDDPLSRVIKTMVSRQK